MNDQTVPAGLPQREPGAFLGKQLRELERGDWVADTRLTEAGAAAEILHAETYTGPGGVERTLGLFRTFGYGDDYDAPQTFDMNAVVSLRLASQQEIAAAERRRRRSEYAMGLRELADIVESDGFPLPEQYQTIRVSISMPPERLMKVAEHLEVGVERSGSTSTVAWPLDGRGASWSPVEALWHAYSPEIAGDPLGMAMARSDDGAFVPGEVADDIRGVTYEERGAEIQVVHEAEQDRAIGTATVPAYEVGLIRGDTADEQRDTAYAAYERDEALTLIDHGPVKPPYGTPERAEYDRRASEVN